MKKREQPMACPCGSESSYEACCGRFHQQQSEPNNALELMKSRYAAFVVKDTDYLFRTWHPETRPESLQLDEPIKWLGLTIEDFVDGDREAYVTFVARGKINGRAFKQKEKSRFLKENGSWYYVDGEL